MHLWKQVRRKSKKNHTAKGTISYWSLQEKKGISPSPVLILMHKKIEIHLYNTYHSEKEDPSKSMSRFYPSNFFPLSGWLRETTQRMSF